jgi:hypothetical protein
MNSGRVISNQDEVTAPWIGHVLKQRVQRLRISSSNANWSRQLAIEAETADGRTHALRLKVCLGNTFGRSEIDYYTRDYVDMPNPPLVRCLDAEYDPAVGYHILLEDLAATHVDRREIPPSLAHGLAVAQALGRLHRHCWGAFPAPDHAALNRYFHEIRPGLDPLEQATGHALRQRFELHERAFRLRWARPHGMSLLHGDLNPTNILTPRGAEAPVYFLDRQPFEWSLTYGVAASDLAYFMIPWWPKQERRSWEGVVLRHWYEALGMPEYSWSDALADWRLSVEQCLNVPMEWCSRPDTLESMRWLWESQFDRVQNALAEPSSDASLSA